jgi:hypothetical protein
VVLGELQPEVASAVALEGAASAVVVPGVELDDDERAGPMGVHLTALDDSVHDRRRESLVTAES